MQASRRGSKWLPGPRGPAAVEERAPAREVKKVKGANRVQLKEGRRRRPSPREVGEGRERVIRATANSLPTNLKRESGSPRDKRPQPALPAPMPGQARAKAKAAVRDRNSGEVLRQHPLPAQKTRLRQVSQLTVLGNRGNKEAQWYHKTRGKLAPREQPESKLPLTRSEEHTSELQSQSNLV